MIIKDLIEAPTGIDRQGTNVLFGYSFTMPEVEQDPRDQQSRTAILVVSGLAGDTDTLSILTEASSHHADPLAITAAATGHVVNTTFEDCIKIVEQTMNYLRRFDFPKVAKGLNGVHHRRLIGEVITQTVQLSIEDIQKG